MNPKVSRPLGLALLSLLLGAALYGALAWAAGAPWLAPLVSLLCAAPLSVLLGFTSLDAWRTGAYPVKFGSIARAREPAQYWLSLAVSGLGCLAAAALALWAGARLLGFG